MSEVRDRLAHLFRRAGFGATPEELDFWEPQGVDAAVDWMLAERPDPTDKDPKPTNFLDGGLALINWWFRKMQRTNRPFREKMTLFWHGHFATSLAKVGLAKYMLQQNETLRNYGMGDFRMLLKKINLDPAMMIWLDTLGSYKDHPNENYSREVMELFTLGRHQYTESDIKELARAFSGYTFDYGIGDNGVKTPWGHDFGFKKIFSAIGDFDADSVVPLLTGHPHCTKFLAWRLYRFFVNESALEGDAAWFGDVIKLNRFNIKESMRALFLSEQFYSPENRYARIKSPVEYTLSLLRDTGTRPDLYSIYYMSAMGQLLMYPPTVEGWKGGMIWMSSTRMFRRFQFAQYQCTKSADGAGSIFSPQTAKTLFGDMTAEQMTDAVCQRMLGRQPEPTTRSLLVGYLSGAKHGSQFVASVESGLKHLRGLANLIAALPDYQLS